MVPLSGTGDGERQVERAFARRPGWERERGDRRHVTNDGADEHADRAIGLLGVGEPGTRPGVAEGERVVTQGIDQLGNGAKVTVVGATQVDVSAIETAKRPAGMPPGP